MHAPRFLVLLVVAGSAIAGVWYAARPAPLRVHLAEVGKGVVERIVANTRAGTVKACRRARLAPGAGGQIDTLEMKEGQRVKAGALLLELWNDLCVRSQDPGAPPHVHHLQRREPGRVHGGDRNKDRGRS